MDILTETFLRPLEKRAAFSFVAILEFSQGEWVMRASQGLTPDLFSTANSWTRAEAVKSAPGIIALPLTFQGEWVGALVAGVPAKDRLEPTIETELRSTGQVIAALLAWRESSWDARCSALSILRDIKNKNPDFNWVGIYRCDPKDPQSLLVSAYIGDATPHEKIPLNQGICGAAISLGQTLNIPDVNADPRYLSCSITTKSELVIPLRNSRGEVVAEIDIDCVKYEGFPPDLEEKLLRQALEIEKISNLFD